MAYFYLVDYDDGTTADIPISMIKEPRKAEYVVGENVLARYPSYSGVFNGTIVAIDEDRTWLKEVKSLPRPIPAKRSEKKGNGNLQEKVTPKGKQDAEKKKRLRL